MKPILRYVLYAFLIWLVPFVAAFAFYSPEGKLVVDKILFKTVMLVVGNLVGIILTVRLFTKFQHANPLQKGYTVGLIFLLINWLLDFAVLLPMSGMAMGDYFIEIGFRYLPMLFTAAGAGHIAAKTSP